jgi:O-antigen/teichoic acid export membrane protein
MKAMLRYLSLEAVCVVMQLCIYIYFIRLFILYNSISDYGLFVFAISAISIFSVFDLPIEIRISKKLKLNTGYHPLKYIVVTKILLLTFIAFILLTIFSFDILLITYAYTFSLTQYVITTIQTTLNVLQRSYLASTLHLGIPITHICTILIAGQTQNPLEFFLSLSSITFTIIFIFSLYYLKSNGLISLRFSTNRRTIFNFLIRFWIFNFKLIFVRIRYLTRQHMPIIIITNVLGNDFAGQYAIILRLLTISNGITSKFTFLNLPKILQTKTLDRHLIHGSTLSDAKKLTLLCFIVILPLTFSYSNQLIQFFEPSWSLSSASRVILGGILALSSAISLLGVFVLTSRNFGRLLLALSAIDVAYFLSILASGLTSLNPIDFLLMVLLGLLISEAIYLTGAAKRDLEC